MATDVLTETATLSLRDRVESLRLPPKVDAKTAGPRGSWLPWIFNLLLAGTTVAALVYRPHMKSVDSSEDASAAVASPLPVGVGSKPATTPLAGPPVATAPTGSVALEQKGNIVPAHQIQVSPVEVSGRIMKLFVEEGKHFKAGEVLAELDQTLYQAEAREATFMMESALERERELQKSRPEEIEQGRFELAEAEETLKQLQRDMARNSNLKGSNGALSIREYDQAEYGYRAQIQRVNRLRKSLDLLELGPREEKKAQAKADVSAARARLQKAQWRLENCVITSPVTGTVLTKKAEQGAFISALSFGNIAASLCDIADLSDLEVDLDVPERDISKVFKGQKCSVRSEAYPERTYPGVVDRLMPIANRGKAAVTVRVKLTVPKEEEGVYLKPEMGVVVSFLAK